MKKFKNMSRNEAIMEYRNSQTPEAPYFMEDDKIYIIDNFTGEKILCDPNNILKEEINDKKFERFLINKYGVNKMQKVTRMYIKMYKAVDQSIEESYDIIQHILYIIRNNLKCYGIDKCNNNVTPNEEIEYYIKELSKKYLHIDNIFETSYWKYEKFIPHDAKERLVIEEIMNNIKTKKEVLKFLEWYKEISCGIVCSFDFTIIELKQITEIINEHSINYTPELRIELQDFNYNFYNPIIAWEFENTLFIMDWVNLKSAIINEEWIYESYDKERFIKEFGIPSLEDYLEKEYDHLHREVRIALEHEVNEFYNLYKNDIKIEDDIAYSISDNMMLVDAIWNHAPLFCNTTIEDLVVKIYKNEIKL